MLKATCYSSHTCAWYRLDCSSLSENTLTWFSSLFCLAFTYSLLSVLLCMSINIHVYTFKLTDTAYWWHFSISTQIPAITPSLHGTSWLQSEVGLLICYHRQTSIRKYYYRVVNLMPKHKHAHSTWNTLEQIKVNHCILCEQITLSHSLPHRAAPSFLH